MISTLDVEGYLIVIIFVATGSPPLHNHTNNPKKQHFIELNIIKIMLMHPSTELTIELFHY